MYDSIGPGLLDSSLKYNIDDDNNRRCSIKYLTAADTRHPIPGSRSVAQRCQQQRTAERIKRCRTSLTATVENTHL